MTTFILRLSDKSTVTLPVELARQAGLKEGKVQVILGERSLTVLPVTPAAGYAIRWEAMAATLRERATQFDFSPKDRRDASYWEIVNPLFEEAERIASSV